jgi:3-hydroxy-9,10-secoandrosta-1,3,5(10)-triene-9,17-dione monooxygenase reductase component
MQNKFASAQRPPASEEARLRLVDPSSLHDVDLDDRGLRDAFGRFATGVAVLTASVEGTDLGVTVNSLTSVSLSPPLLLFCLDKKLVCYEAMAGAEQFAVNVLHDGQEALSARFGRPGGKRFDDGLWSPGVLGAPVLKGAMAVFEVIRRSTYDAGDHLIVVAEVGRAAMSEGGDPLLFFEGRYRSVHVPG